MYICIYLYLYLSIYSFIFCSFIYDRVYVGQHSCAAAAMFYIYNNEKFILLMFYTSLHIVINGSY